MNLAEQLRVLEAAKGHGALLALATVDFAYPDLPTEARAEIKDALVAAAIPHWFDQDFLAALLPSRAERGAPLFEQLLCLTTVEPFRARGERTFNVHEATRLALREHLQQEDPNRWKTLSTLARRHVVDGVEPHVRIEALYHLFAIDQVAAAAACEALDREFTGGRPEFRYAFALALKELTAAGWLTGRAQVEALLAQLKVRMWRQDAPVLEPDVQEVVTLAERAAHPSGLRRACYLLGLVMYRQGHLDGASAAFDRSIALCESAAATEANGVGRELDLSAALMALGDVQQAKLDLVGAEGSYRKALAILQHAAVAEPSNADCLRELAVAYTRVAEIDREGGRLDDAAQGFQAALTILRHLTTIDPANADWQRELGAAMTCIADVSRLRGELDEALRMCAEVLVLSERLAASDPDNFEWQRDVAFSQMQLGDMSAALGRTDDALAAYDRAREILDGLAAIDTSNARIQRDLALALHLKGVMLHRKGDEPSAQANHRDATGRMQRAVGMSPENKKWADELRQLQSWLQP